MKIEIGKMYQNKTWKYLGPTLTFYGKEFTDKFNTIFKVAAGVGDTTHAKEVPPSLYLLCDAKYQPSNFNQVMQWMRYQPYYVTDYPYDTDLKDVRRHMLVLEVPKPYLKAYQYLLQGEYSKMYLKEQIEGMFDPRRKDVLDVLFKREDALVAHVKKINAHFGTSLKVEEYDKNSEYDSPFKDSEEIFNY